MKLSALLTPLLNAKVDHELIRQQILAYEQQQEDALEHRRQVDAERQARKRERDRSRDVTLRHSDRSLTGDQVTRAEVKTSKPDIEPLKKQTHSADVEAFKAAFAGVCDPERVEAIIKHRRTKRGQITGHAASLFIADAKAAGLSVPDAVDTCISRNWITVKADWLAPNQRGSPAAQQAPSMSQLFQAIRDTPHENQPEPPEDRSSLRPAIPHLRAVGSG